MCSGTKLITPLINMFINLTFDYNVAIAVLVIIRIHPRQRYKHSS